MFKLDIYLDCRSIKFYCVFWMIVLDFLHGTRSSYCPPANPPDTGALEWSVPPATLAYGCIGQYVALHCCATGYNSMIWYIQQAGHSKELVHFRYNKRLEPGSENQTLEMLAADLRVDRGKYTCVATDHSGQTMTSTVTLNITECGNWHFPPKVYQPQNNLTEIEVELGTNLNVSCSAFYGNCHSSEIFNPCYIDWWRVHDHKEDTPIPDYSNVSSRVFHINYQDDSESTGTNVLYIKNVRMSDYGHYRCWAYSAYKPDTQRNVFIRQKIVPKKWDPKIVLTICFSIIMVPLVVMLIYWEYGLDIKLWYKDTFKRRKHDEVKEYDAAILYSENAGDDVEFAENILYGKLSENYELFRSRLDILPGEWELGALAFAQTRSHMVIFVISEEFFMDEKCLFVLRQMVDEDYRDMIFVIHKPLRKDVLDMLNRTEDTKVILTAMKRGRQIKWPNERAGARKHSLFWKRLRYELPAKKCEREDEGSENEHLCTDNDPTSHYGSINNETV